MGTIVFPFQIWFGSGYISHIMYKTLYNKKYINFYGWVFGIYLIPTNVADDWHFGWFRIISCLEAHIYICMKYLFIILTALYSCWFRNLKCRFTYSCWNRGTICSLALFIYINFYFSILLFLLRFYMGNHIILSWLGKFYMEPKKRHFILKSGKRVNE